ncbi:MAG: hypothetical protein DRN13_01335 [Thermoplasmata archaeon]|nr:MAG: hypothetical protein DRN13_01335 [Thermoplasmata archaeon]
MRYWKRYDRRYKLNNILNLCSFIKSKARKLGEPFSKRGKRGRSLKISPYDYLVSFILYTYLDLSLRDNEFLSIAIFGKHVDHSTFGKAYDRIPYSYLRRLLVLIRNEIENLIKERPVLIADSTGIRIDRRYGKAMIGCKTTKRREHDKLIILVEYYPENMLISISNADALIRSDPLSSAMMLENLDTRSDYFFGDAGFDSEVLYMVCFKKGIKPVVKQRSYGRKRGRLRKRAMECFDPDLYRRYRGVIEGVFGGLENRRLLFTRYRKESMRSKHIIAMALIHNINTYMAIICLFILIFSTNSRGEQILYTSSSLWWMYGRRYYCEDG